MNYLIHFYRCSSNGPGPVRLRLTAARQSPQKMDIERPHLLSFIPGYYLTNTVEFHQIYMNFENNLTKYVPPNYVPCSSSSSPTSTI